MNHPYTTWQQALDDTLTQRDQAQAWADRLARAIGIHFDVDVGEHSSDHNPWAAALDALDELPDDKPGEALGPAGRAEWALRRLLAASDAEPAAGTPRETARWYMVNNIGMATLCADRDDAEREAANAREAFPQSAPHRVVQLAEVEAAPGPRTPLHEAACQAYGWLWHGTAGDPNAQRARNALVNALTREDMARGIREARALGATVDGAAIEARMMRGLE